MVLINTTTKHTEVKMTKQTAVKKLINQIPLGIRMQLLQIGIDFEEAIEMEKEQIISAFNNGEFFASDYYHPGSPSVDGSENYYIETYGGK